MLETFKTVMDFSNQLVQQDDIEILHKWVGRQAAYQMS